MHDAVLTPKDISSCIQLPAMLGPNEILEERRQSPQRSPGSTMSTSGTRISGSWSWQSTRISLVSLRADYVPIKCPSSQTTCRKISFNNGRENTNPRSGPIEALANHGRTLLEEAKFQIKISLSKTICIQVPIRKEMDAATECLATECLATDCLATDCPGRPSAQGDRVPNGTWVTSNPKSFQIKPKGARKLLPPVRSSLKRKFGFKKDFKMGLG